MNALWHHSLAGLVLPAAVLLVLSSAGAAEKAKGTLTYKGSAKTFMVELKHAYLVKGPDMFEKGKTIRRLVLSPDDFSAAIKGSEAMDGIDGKLKEGMIVDLLDGPRLNYWIVLNNQLVQYSGTVEPGALTSSVHSADHVAGKLVIDDSSAGGPKIDVEFDAPLLKSFAKAR